MGKGDGRQCAQKNAVVAVMRVVCGGSDSKGAGSRFEENGVQTGQSRRQQKIKGVQSQTRPR